MERKEQAYFHWLVSFVCDPYEEREYRYLLEALFYKDFRWSLEMDENMAYWGIYMRDRYGKNTDFMPEECSILEMMVALCLNMEEKIASNSDFGDRTGDWFWSMIDNLGLKSFNNRLFDDRKVDKILEKFLDRGYKSDGTGGLFKSKNCRSGANLKDIWMQAMNFLSEVMEENGEIW